jgi:tetratricopeptide (TPR) repeat protein
VSGWFIFDLGHFDAAVPHFEEVRTAAHEARNTELGALILGNLAQTAIWQDRPRLAVDHASAAVAWAWRTPDRALQANTCDMAARAYAAAGEYDACMTELDRAAGALALRDDHPSLSYWYDEAFLASIHGQCLLDLRRPAEALAIIGPSVTALDSAMSVRNLAMTIIDLGSAHIQHGEIEEGARALGRASELAVRNRSVRLATHLGSARQHLEPWKDTPAVRELDEKMAALRVLQGEAL